MIGREELAEALERSRDTRGRVRPRRDLKRRVAEYAVAQLERGEPMGRLARLLGLGEMTLRRWLARFAEQPGSIVPVQVAPDVRPEVSSLVVHGPSGIRVEGMTVAEVAELVQRLS